MGVAKWIALGLGVGVAGAVIGSAIYLWTPADEDFAADDARTKAQAYDARVIRDAYGVPHIYGQRNVDVAFGLAYAHAEDDWYHTEQVLVQNRGQLAAITGQEGAASDYLMYALGNIENVAANYDTEVSEAARGMAEAYAAGLNLWCADNPASGCERSMPATGVDIITGFANRPPFFYGLDGEIGRILSGSGPVEMSPAPAREAYLRTTADVELGSNALAVAPSRSTDGHTRMAVNSHQPYTGTVAWYEARLKSEEGIDVIGGLFPGSPVIFGGVGPNFGWAATVNHPDLSDVFKLTVDDEEEPTQYMMDGEWRDLEVTPIKFRVKLWGPFSLPVTQRGLRSEHGPVLVTDRGVFAVSYVGDRELGHMDHYLAMNTAKTVDDWRAAQIKYNAIPSINYVVADSQGNIGYFYNAHMPKREEGWDRTKVLPGDTSATLWKGWEPVESLPAVVNPTSGYVISANHSPLLASAPEDNPKAEDFPESYGLDTLVTNRSLRAQVLYSEDAEISREEFLAYKMDDKYDPRSNVMKMVAELAAAGAGDDEELKAALDVITPWDGSADRTNRRAALAILTGQRTMGGQIHGETTLEEAQAMLKSVAAELQATYGRIDPEWGEVSRLERGGQTWALDGGPDTLRAVYVNGDLAANGYLSGVAGDTYIAIADWAPDGTYQVDTIHQFGAATMDETSPHYADQAPLFAEEVYRQPPMTLDAVLAQATRDYRPGKSAE